MLFVVVAVFVGLVWRVFGSVLVRRDGCALCFRYGSLAKLLENSLSRFFGVLLGCRKLSSGALVQLSPSLLLLFCVVTGMPPACSFSAVRVCQRTTAWRINASAVLMLQYQMKSALKSPQNLFLNVQEYSDMPTSFTTAQLLNHVSINT